MAQGCAGNGANVVEGLVTPRPWAVEVVAVTDADTSTTTAAGSDGADGARITTPTDDRLRAAQMAQEVRVMVWAECWVAPTYNKRAEDAQSAQERGDAVRRGSPDDGAEVAPNCYKKLQ